MKKIIAILLFYLSVFTFSNALIKVDITRGNLDPLTYSSFSAACR